MPEPREDRDKQPPRDTAIARDRDHEQRDKPPAVERATPPSKDERR